MEAAPETSLVVFHTFRDTTRIEVPVTIANNCLAIGGWLRERMAAGQIPADGYVMRQQLNAEFTGSAINFEVGAILEDAGKRLPEWIRYKDTTTAEDNLVTIWLSDESFSNQYDEFSIEVIPPLVPLDDFFKDPLLVKQALAGYDLVEKTEDVQAARGEYPFTMINPISISLETLLQGERKPILKTVNLRSDRQSRRSLSVVHRVLALRTHCSDNRRPTESSVVLRNS